MSSPRCNSRVVSRPSRVSASAAARARSAAPQLVTMLSSTHEIEALAAHQALIEIYGQDLGALPEDWEDVLR